MKKCRHKKLRSEIDAIVENQTGQSPTPLPATISCAYAGEKRNAGYVFDGPRHAVLFYCKTQRFAHLRDLRELPPSNRRASLARHKPEKNKLVGRKSCDADGRHGRARPGDRNDAHPLSRARRRERLAWVRNALQTRKYIA